MRNTVLTIAAACLIAAPGVFAQTIHPEHSNSAVGTEQNIPSATVEHNGRNISKEVNEHVSYLTTVLSLSSEQQQKAMNIFTDVANQNSPLINSLKTDRKELTAAVEENEPNSRIKQISDKLGNEVSQLACNEASAGEQFYHILNPQQQTKLTQLQNENFGRMGMGWGVRGM